MENAGPAFGYVFADESDRFQAQALSVSDTSGLSSSASTFKAKRVSDHDKEGENLLQLIKEKKVKKALSLLVGHDGRAPVDPNFQDHDGNTALHIAVEVKSEILVKLMIVFDANLSLKNHKGNTALDIAKKSEYKGAKNIATIIECIRDKQNVLYNEPKSPAEFEADIIESDASSNAEAKPNFMLSLDGGGIRGLVFVQVLLEMEKRRKKLYPKAGTLLSKFNWITGNSTGGIAALAFAAAKTKVDKARRLYFDMKDQVLGYAREPPIPNDKVENVFQKIYGTKATMKHIERVNVSIMTTLATQSPPILHIMSNYGKAQNGQDPPEKQLVWKAARATSAVPIIFHPQDGIYLDGGLIANNPTCDAIIDMPKDQQSNLKLVLSLGCGYSKPEAIEDVDFEHTKFAHGLGWLLGRNKYAEFGGLILTNLKATRHVLDIVGAQITQPNGEVLLRSEFVSKAVGAKYYRINPPIGSVDFLETNDEILIKMLYQVVKHMLKICCKDVDPILKCIYEK